MRDAICKCGHVRASHPLHWLDRLAGLLGLAADNMLRRCAACGCANFTPRKTRHKLTPDEVVARLGWRNDSARVATGTDVQLAPDKAEPAE